MKSGSSVSLLKEIWQWRYRKMWHVVLNVEQCYFYVSWHTWSRNDEGRSGRQQGASIWKKAYVRVRREQRAEWEIFKRAGTVFMFFSLKVAHTFVDSTSLWMTSFSQAGIFSLVRSSYFWTSNFGLNLRTLTANSVTTIEINSKKKKKRSKRENEFKEIHALSWNIILQRRVIWMRVNHFD